MPNFCSSCYSYSAIATRTFFTFSYISKISNNTFKISSIINIFNMISCFICSSNKIVHIGNFFIY